jgi:glycosyltransferase involved in cell wall biosynthesis
MSEGKNTTNSSSTPFVSALLVTYNESQYIRRSLDSLLCQDYPHNSYEIIIVDGGSTDNTIALAKELIAEHEDSGNTVQVSFIDNPKKILAVGWNLGIRNAKGEYVIRIDAHAVAHPDFLRLNVKTMMSVDAVCVGGKLITEANSETGAVIRDILSSSFGVGNSSFRTSNEAGYADTAVYGLYKKEIFVKAGDFDETLVRNQDVEMHSRIKRTGGRFYFNPAIVSTYYSRDTIKKMLKQAYGNGFWNLIILKKNNAKLSIRHMIPFCFVLFLIITTLLGIAWRPFWILEAVVLSIYFSLAIFASLRKTKNISRVMKMPFLFFALHIAYGSGSIVGLFKTKY